MSKFTDRIKNVFTVDYDDYDEDYYDDYEDDDMDLEPEKPEKKERVTKSRSERFSARRAATRSDDDIIDDYGSTCKNTCHSQSCQEFKKLKKSQGCSNEKQ